MSKPPFAEAWTTIKTLQGERFATKRELPFTYSVAGDALTTTRTDYPLGRAEFEKAYRLVPCKGPGEFNNDVRGPAYVWAILHDERVRKGRW